MLDQMKRVAEAIAKEASAANDVIRLKRNADGSGRVKVATALHRIAALSQDFLAIPLPATPPPQPVTDADVQEVWDTEALEYLYQVLRDYETGRLERGVIAVGSLSLEMSAVLLAFEGKLAALTAVRERRGGVG